AFRGLTIAGMLLVNNMALGELTPDSLTHADWSGGITFADLVFPWFLFIVGVAIPWSAASRRRHGLSRGRYAWKVLGRTVTLVLLGWLLDSSIARAPVTGLGVLQLIGLAYCAGALLYDLPGSARAAIAAALLVGHWAAIRFVPVPELGAGAFTESQNLIQHLNERYLQAYNLKGLISAVPTTALVLIGTLAGDHLRRESVPVSHRAGHLAAAGAVLVALGWLWSLDLPFNKPLWTAPYIVLSAGYGGLILAAFYAVMDVHGWKGWALPLVVFGSNAIVAYVAPILVKLHTLQEWKWAGTDLTLQQALLQAATTHWGPIAGGWAYTGGYILFWWLVLLYLYRKKLFLRV
ncbi:MAG TPA: DUF5009 domain-containing protein, partial [Armatimonadota bacterium]|nr:DUF5009 domain-containing protein [Armatimonadota bacterium]